jgi:hypothetical protein
MLVCVVLQYLKQGQPVRDVLVRLRKSNVPQPRGSSSVKLEGERDTVWYWSTERPYDITGAPLQADTWYKLAGVLSKVTQVLSLYSLCAHYNIIHATERVLYDYKTRCILLCYKLRVIGTDSTCTCSLCSVKMHVLNLSWSSNGKSAHIV